jgi:hypothetical protein
MAYCVCQERAAWVLLDGILHSVQNDITLLLSTLSALYPRPTITPLARLGVLGALAVALELGHFSTMELFAPDPRIEDTDLWGFIERSFAMADKERERNEQMGGLAGLGAGVLAGAQVGTVVLPVPVVGTFVGALVGGVLGSAVGQRVGGAALSGVNAFLDDLTGQRGKGSK